MDRNKADIQRILIVHPEESTRKSIGQALQRVSPDPVALYEATSSTEGLQSVRGIDPGIILLDLSHERGLAFEIAREFRRSGRLIIGLYDPLLEPQTRAEFFRQAVRAGVGDFVALPAAEAELREALAAARPAGERTEAREGRLVTFCSHKGGVGTSTLAVNAALALARSGAVEGGVALCDAAAQFGSVAGLLGFSPDRDLGDLVRDLDTIDGLSAYLTRHRTTGLHVLPSSSDPWDAARITPEDMSRVLIGLRRRFGLIVVDTPPVMDLLALAALDLSERILVVTEAVSPTIVTTGRFVQFLRELGVASERLRIVLNRHSSFEGNLSEELVSEHIGRPVDHVIEYNRALLTAANRGAPLVLNRKESAFSAAMNRLASDILE